jgi:hypothetical protein
VCVCVCVFCGVFICFWLLFALSWLVVATQHLSVNSEPQNFESFPKTEDGMHIPLEEVKRSVAELVVQGALDQQRAEQKLAEVEQ